ncbi:MAG: hypothetical protein A4E64_01576 [Syntrophorhabdus sp. PtaU1.Bin058]|nr:MAG: hypothetical protein A4E64_01576 [Syntrophorhabdus sp. PtaU1.Bin058]
MELEKRGLPTTTICTTNFSALLKTTAKAKGLVDMPLVIVTHPIALNDNAAIRKKADGAIEDVVRTLVTADARTAAKGGR